LLRILEKYNMPCHAMHPIQDLFLESFSYELQFDMHFYMRSYLQFFFILVKNGCYKSEETGNWCVESAVAESEILVLQLAFSAAHSADMGGN
jgi:hypothetical protein